jgi:hypothetical protein
MSSWLKTVQKSKKPSETRRVVVPGILFSSTDLTWAIPETYRENFAQHQKCSLQWGSDNQRHANTVVQAGSLVPICKLYEDFTPPLNEIYHQRSGMASYSKELTSPPSYKREVYMVAAGIPFPDQLWKGPGGGGTSFSEKCKIPLAYQFIWPSEFVRSAKDDSDNRLAIKRQL